MNIIAVDDELINIQAMDEMLTECAPKDHVQTFQFSKDALEYAKNNPVDVAFLDIEMPVMNGISLAKQLKQYHPYVNIIFATGYMQYGPQASKLRSSGYLMKPVDKEQIEEELKLLRFPVNEASKPEADKPDIQVITFGSFHLLYKGEEIRFNRSKSKEAFAYLIDRGGIPIDRKEICRVLFEDQDYDRKTQKYLNNILSDMKASLQQAGLSSILKMGFNSYAVDITKISCDLYDYRKGDIDAINSFCGKYMEEYSWGEYTLGSLYQ